ncbi:class I SAM-dependent methyltransferase [Nocardia sp. CDC159]|uniref:Class I SAM-dependent methyltransferase n=1 Tax=Nocardia pulmonis TaxID=2951408 RepID=A0A9X2IXR0_9NOCA|nr:MULTISPECIES: class I SAM-dependent methyltransferase [Nocardia]MCM6776287.1 class I SAM-dependent methyltransferase [Nocardia pulmonis]MCM6788711.1 class I SAM-dependent methyltransferase [Nocardia sp. CDC159]
MNAPHPLPVNHHADHRGFSGPLGTALGLYMFLAGRGRARAIADLAAVTPSDHVVDIGCGSGAAVAAAARHGARVTGVEPAPAMLRLARTLVHGKRIRWTPGTAENLPLDDATATIAWAIATIHHWPDVTSGLTEAHRILTPGGRFLAVERATLPHATGLSSHGWTEPQAHSFADQCRAAAFTDVHIDHHDLGRYAIWVVQARRPLN